VSAAESAARIAARMQRGVQLMSPARSAARSAAGVQRGVLS